MFASSYATDGLHERFPGFALLSENFSAFGRHAVVTPPPLALLFDPRALDPPALLEAIEQRIQGIDVKGQLSAGAA